MPGSVQDEIQGINEHAFTIVEERPDSEERKRKKQATQPLEPKKGPGRPRKQVEVDVAEDAEIELDDPVQLNPGGHKDATVEPTMDEDQDSDADIASDTISSPKPVKKAKLALPEIAAYVDVVVPPRTMKAKETILSRGPCFFTVATPHIEFLQSIATCAVEPKFAPMVSSINQKALFWKLQVPANDKKKPLANESGYQALIAKIKSLLDKEKDGTITVILPPLSKVVRKDATQLSGGMDSGDEEVMPTAPLSATIREQKSSSVKGIISVKTHNFPTSVSTAPDGRSWELNNFRLQLWAQKIAAPVPTATLDAPPNSTFFADSQKLRVPINKSAAIPDITSSASQPLGSSNPANVHGYPMPYGYPIYPPGPFFPPYGGYHPQAPFFSHPGVVGMPNAQGVLQPNILSGTITAPGPGSAPSPPMKLVLPHPIPLTEFCERYEIDDEDQACLVTLKFRPGDRRAEGLSREDWQGHAGFSCLAWDDFILKHKQFVQDVKSGLWA